MHSHLRQFGSGFQAPTRSWPQGAMWRKPICECNLGPKWVQNSAKPEGQLQKSSWDQNSAKSNKIKARKNGCGRGRAPSGHLGEESSVEL